APFYCALLGLEEAFATDDRSVIALSGAGPMITLMRAEEFTAPQWPHGPQRAQVHLDLAAQDLEAAVSAARGSGAREADVQPWPAAWRVMLDPVAIPSASASCGPAEGDAPRGLRRGRALSGGARPVQSSRRAHRESLTTCSEPEVQIH